MKKVKKILIIGHFGGKENLTDGQTVKTKTLYDGLKENTDWKIKIVDTFYRKSMPITTIFKSFFSVLFSKRIIVMLSGNGMKAFFPFLYFASKFLRKEIYHDVIGGNLNDYISSNKKFTKYLNSFKWNWVETEMLKSKVEAYGINNCLVIPNFKNIIPLDSVTNFTISKPYTFCVFSRIMKEKGIDEAIKAIETVNNNANETICCLDLYGPIDKEFEHDFSKIVSNSQTYIRYKGIIPPKDSVSVISKYYCLLFPTRWRGEGFPGTLLDAMFSGVPVIATNWGSNTEIIINNVTGIVYNPSQVELSDVICSFLKMDDTHYFSMRENCLLESKKYSSNYWIHNIIQLIEQRNS
jgi:glycosyltransferase involved in cell wall biosynthesis